MSFFKNIEAGLNSGLDALAQEYSKLDNQPAGGGSGSREEGGGSSSAEEASGSVGQRVSALLNEIEPGSLSNLEQSASGALKAFTPKLPVTPSLKLPSTDGLFPGFLGDAATEDEDKVTAAAATETNASPPEAAEAARRIAEAEARAAAAEERATAAEARAATAERMAEDVEMRAEAAVEEAEARAAIAEDAARRSLLLLPTARCRGPSVAASPSSQSRGQCGQARPFCFSSLVGLVNLRLDIAVLCPYVPCLLWYRCAVPLCARCLLATLSQKQWQSCSSIGFLVFAINHYQR